MFQRSVSISRLSSYDRTCIRHSNTTPINRKEFLDKSVNTCHTLKQIETLTLNRDTNNIVGSRNIPHSTSVLHSRSILHSRPIFHTSPISGRNSVCCESRRDFSSHRSTDGMGGPYDDGPRKLKDLETDRTFLTKLDTDPAQAKANPHQSRPVPKGHYIHVNGEPLDQAFFICGSRSFASEIGLSVEEFKSEQFLKVFSANSDAIPESWSKPWATPYGVSVHGWWATNSPFGVGGYGDGRAMSIVSLKGSTEKNWELQLKGSGRTAFSRNHDGRAVLRSSVREFLTSEAFHHLGVPATRALSLVGCSGTTIMRHWYSDSTSKQSMEMMRKEPCAITCRAAPSFLRVGQMELYARTRPKEELHKMISYAMEKEFGDVIKAPYTIDVDNLIKLAETFADRQCFMHSEWLRVGYIQGNMNNDNALLCGRTMDFGPFGMLEEFNRRQQIWEGDGEGKFAYANQPAAGNVIFMTLAQSLIACLEEGKEQEKLLEKLQDLLKGYMSRFAPFHEENCRKKLGAAKWEDVKALWKEGEDIWEKEKVDFIHFFRCLAEYAAAGSPAEDDAIQKSFTRCLYKGKITLSDSVLKWIKQWREKVPNPDVATMKKTSPAIIPRNWMLVLAYEAAEKGDFSIVKELHELFENPYSDSVPCKWLTRSPDWQYGKGGVRYMS